MTSGGGSKKPDSEEPVEISSEDVISVEDSSADALVEADGESESLSDFFYGHLVYGYCPMFSRRRSGR